MSNLIIDVRGTHGSGKTHTARHVLGKYETIEYEGPDAVGREKPLATYVPDINTYFIGTYRNPCGGADKVVQGPNEVCRRIRMFAEKGHVVVEGIIVSHTHQRYSDLSKEMIQQGHRYKFLFLDTPLEQCIANVQNRRVESGKPPEFKTDNLTKDFHQIRERTYTKLVADGCDAVFVEADQAGEILHDLLIHGTGE